MTDRETAVKCDGGDGESPSASIEQSGETTPRVLVRIIIFERDSADVADIGYEAQHPTGVLPIEDDYRVDAIGYAEFEPYARIGRETDLETFMDVVEEHAEYIHWKPVIQESDGVDFT